MGMVMFKRTVYALCVIAGLCFFQTAATAGDPNKIPAYDFKHPTDWLELNTDLRLRAEYDNARKLDNKAVGHERVVFPRFRARAGQTHLNS